MTLPGRAVVHMQKIPYHLKKAKRLRIKLNDRELGNEQSINERLYQLVAVFSVWFSQVRELPALRLERRGRTVGAARVWTA